jgi:molybdopterin converting factor small subunit
MDVFLSGGCDCRSFLASLDQILPAAASAELGRTFMNTRSALEKVLPSLRQVPAAFPEERQMNVSLVQGLSTLARGLDADALVSI